MLAFSLIGLTFGAGAVVAQERAGETNSQQGQVVTAYLDYREVSFSYMTWSPPVVKRAAPFNKEPSFGGGTVHRGVLKLGGGASNDLAFAWNRTTGKLYLDLNGNLDLTDDAGGPFACQAARNYTQRFSDIHLPYQTPAGTWRMLVDLSLWDEGRLTCNLSMRSFWEGKVTLHGEEWQVGLLRHEPFLETAPGSTDFLLRPWSDHAKPFGFYDDRLDIMPFPPKLFLGSHAYELRCADEGRGQSARMRLEFAEREVKLGELKISGAFVRRVMLEGGHYRVVLDNPPATAKVPVGGYAAPKVCLQKGGLEACLDPQMPRRSDRVIVGEKTPGVLVAGGPLTNSISISKRGKYLNLNYHLEGVGGVYRLLNQDRSHPPEFTVYRGDKKLASGRFQYG